MQIHQSEKASPQTPLPFLCLPPQVLPLNRVLGASEFLVHLSVFCMVQKWFLHILSLTSRTVTSLQKLPQNCISNKSWSVDTGRQISFDTTLKHKVSYILNDSEWQYWGSECQSAYTQGEGRRRERERENNWRFWWWRVWETLTTSWGPMPTSRSVTHLYSFNFIYTCFVIIIKVAQGPKTKDRPHDFKVLKSEKKCCIETKRYKDGDDRRWINCLPPLRN